MLEEDERRKVEERALQEAKEALAAVAERRASEAETEAQRRRAEAKEAAKRAEQVEDDRAPSLTTTAAEELDLCLT